MEVEFLSNIRYDLFASKEEWARWHTKLGLFGDYFNQASKLPAESATPSLHVSPPRLKPQSPSAKLSSSPSDVLRPQSQPNWYMPVPGLPYPAPQLSNETPMAGSRKRSRDDETDLQPTKRIARSTANSTPTLTVPSTTTNAIPTLPPVLAATSAPAVPAHTLSNVSRLPPPNLPPSSNPMPQSIPSTSMSQLPTPAFMPPVQKNWPQQTAPTAVPSVASGLYNNSLPDLSRHHQSTYGPTTSIVSPAVPAYIHPQDHLSPSFFLANRNSPYRPVRSCHTLLIPPPSTSMHQQRSVPFDHMHYQPLGKGTADRKTGLLPYIHPEVWSQPYSHPPYYPPTQNYSG